MPLIHIEIEKGYDKAFLISLIEETINIVQEVLMLPEDDRNIRLTEFDKELFILKAPYRMIIGISMFTGRTPETKKELFKRIVTILSAKLPIKKEEIFILLNEQPQQNWGIKGGIPASETDLGFKVEI